MLQAGEWRPTAESADPGTIGFHISALYSPVGWLSWADIARMWEAAQATDEAKRSFKNGVLGRTWVETGEAPDWQRLYERREAWPFGTVPAGGLFLTAGADVQKDRIEVDVWAWGRGLESWLVDHIVIEGGPERGRDLGRARPACSTGPGRTRMARSLASPSSRSTPATKRPRSMPGRARMGHAQVAPIKGVEGFNRAAPVVGPDPCRCDRRRQEASPRRAALDDRGLDLQERDLSLPAAGAADR